MKVILFARFCLPNPISECWFVWGMILFYPLSYCISLNSYTKCLQCGSIGVLLTNSVFTSIKFQFSGLQKGTRKLCLMLSRRLKLVITCFNLFKYVFWELVLQGKQSMDVCLTFDDTTAELMILGFISLLLTFGQKYISKICVPIKVAESMLPCAKKVSTTTEEEHRRKLLWFERRFLASDSKAYKCKTVSESIPKLILGFWTSSIRLAMWEWS